MWWMLKEIEARGGEVYFDEFMELALYHPEHGYYSSDAPRYGRGGDFLTAPTASEWYARVLARFLRRLAGEHGPVRFVDLASGDGKLIAALIEGLGPDAACSVAEIISVERSSAMRVRQARELPATSVGVRVVKSLTDGDASSLPTVLHASELYDALPVARIVGGEKRPQELVVVVSDGRLAWQRRPLRKQVRAYLSRHEIDLEEGQIAEVNLGSESLHAELLSSVGGTGLSMILDYGYETRRLFDPKGRRGGSLTTFHRHELGRDPLTRPGEVDLTAHINWDDLRAAADAAGWQEVGLWPLAEFLVRAGIARELEKRALGIEADLDAATVTARQEVKRLLDPEGMGSDLKMLVQAKGEMVDVARSALALNSEF
jgi:SAM-dependent MidA family methyltransferase